MLPARQRRLIRITKTSPRLVHSCPLQEIQPMDTNQRSFMGSSSFNLTRIPDPSEPPELNISWCRHPGTEAMRMILDVTWDPLRQQTEAILDSIRLRLMASLAEHPEWAPAAAAMHAYHHPILRPLGPARVGPHPELPLVAGHQLIIHNNSEQAQAFLQLYQQPPAAAPQQQPLNLATGPAVAIYRTDSGPPRPPTPRPPTRQLQPQPPLHQ